MRRTKRFFCVSIGMLLSLKRVIIVLAPNGLISTRSAIAPAKEDISMRRTKGLFCVSIGMLLSLKRVFLLAPNGLTSARCIIADRPMSFLHAPSWLLLCAKFHIYVYSNQSRGYFYSSNGLSSARQSGLKE